MASFRSHAWRKELFDSGNDGNNEHQQFAFRNGSGFNQKSSLDDNYSSSPDSAKSFSDTQLEIFHHRHGLLILHLLATLMFIPCLVAWLQRIGLGESFPWFLDSVLCTGVVLHGICNSNLESHYLSFRIPGISRWEMRLSFFYWLAGCYSYLSGLALAPYKGFYAMAAIGFISFAWKFTHNKNSIRKHSHRH